MFSFQRLFLLLGVLTVMLLELSFINSQSNFITVKGEAKYNKKEYPGQKAKVVVTEDGKPYKTLYSDSKGEFQVKILFNHVYMFNLSMDYHATSKVEVNSHVPQEVATGKAGGLFEFDCEMFERLEGLNTVILNKPILKLKYIPEKNDFKYDEEWIASREYDMDGFRARIAELKKRRKDVLKEAPSRGELAQNKNAAPKERKAIVFESEKEKPKKKSTNRRGSRNIMDMMDEEPEVAKVEEVITEEEADLEEEVNEEEVAVTEDVDLETLESDEPEEIYQEEELDPSTFVALNVAPKRVLIDEVVESEESLDFEKVTLKKMKIQEILEITRLDQEVEIREEINTYNVKAFIQREIRLSNKKLQNERLRELIKTIALAEIYLKRDYYEKHPIRHNNIEPSIVSQTKSSWWVSEEEVMVKYPYSSVRFTKKTYWFGVTKYYQGEEEIDEDNYCSNITQLSQNQFICEA